VVSSAGPTAPTAAITVSAAWLTVAGNLLPKSQFLRLPGSRLAQQILPAHKKIAF
jgi:hypothetical protein